MQIDLATTLTVCVLGEAWTEDHLRQQTRALLAKADEIESVRAAKKKFDEATAYVEMLSGRHVELNLRAVETGKRMATARDHLRQAMVAGREFEAEAFQTQGLAKTEHEGVSAALELLVGEIVPGARADLLAAKFRLLDARAAAILQVANERASKIAEQLAVTADSDGGVEIDVIRIPTIASLMSERRRLIDLCARGRGELEAVREDLKGRQNLKVKG